MSRHLTSTQFNYLADNFVKTKFDSSTWGILRTTKEVIPPNTPSSAYYGVPGWNYIIQVYKDGKVIARSESIINWRINCIGSDQYAFLLATLKEVEENE